MSLLLKKISFSIYNITSIKNEQLFLDYLKSLPPRDIKDEPVVETYFFTDPIDTEKGGYHLTHESLSFCFRIDKKPIPKKRLETLLKAKIEKIRVEEGRELDKKKDKQEIQMLYYELAKEMSVGQNPVENTIQVIIDRDTKTLFVEKKGGLTEEVVGLLGYNGGVFCDKVIPFKGDDKMAQSDRLKEFTSWLYQSMANKSNYIEHGAIKLGTSIKLQDKDSEVSIKGNITKYIKTYGSVMDEGKVKECRVFFDDEENKVNLQYSLSCQDLYFSAYSSSGYSAPKNETFFNYNSIELRREDLINFVNHFKNLAEYFEEFMELEGVRIKK
jgi:hypothetical protein